MKLKELRKSHQKTQAEIAKYLAITQSNYGKYELETIEPDIQTLSKLADLYHTSVDYIIGRETQILDLNGIKPIKKRLILDILNMNEIQEIRTQSYIDGLLQR